MRIRATKPEFYRSKTVAALSWSERFVLKALESYVDDNGVGKDDLALIAADAFPRDLSGNPRETLANLSEALDRFSEAGLVARYEVDGEALIYINRWKELQRIDKPSKGRFRRPDGTLEYAEDVARETYRRAPETLAPGTGEQGNRGTGEQTLSSDESDARDETPERFDEWWDLYGKKVGKKAALANYKRSLKKRGVTEQLLLNATAAYVRHQTEAGNHPKYSKDPERWLSGEHWNDEREADRNPDEPTPWGIQPLPAPPPDVADDPDAYDQFLADWREGRPVVDADGNTVRRAA